MKLVKALIRNFIFLLAFATIGCGNKVALDENGMPSELVIGVYGGKPGSYTKYNGRSATNDGEIAWDTGKNVRLQRLYCDN